MSDPQQPQNDIPVCPKHYVLVGLISAPAAANEALAARIKSAYSSTRILRFSDLPQEAIIEEFELLNAIDHQLAEDAYALYMLDGVQAAAKHLQSHCKWWPALLQCIEREFVSKSDGEYFVAQMLDRIALEAAIGIMDCEANMAGKPLLIITDVHDNKQAELVQKFHGANFQVMLEQSGSGLQACSVSPVKIQACYIDAVIHASCFEQAYASLRKAINDFEESG